MRKVYGEYGEFRVVCGTQSRRRIRRKNICVLRKGAKRHKTENISVVMLQNEKSVRSLLSLKDRMDNKQFQATIPLSSENVFFFSLLRWNDISWRGNFTVQAVD
jgi:hypothetical protein